MAETKLRVMTDLIERYAAHMTQRGLSEITITDRVRNLKRMDIDLPMGLETATVEEISDWLARRGWSRETRAKYYGDVKGFFTFACNPANPHLDWNPAESLIRPHTPRGVPKPVTDDELAEAIRTAGNWRVSIILAAYAGMRCIEIAGVERRDINQHTITVRGKGDKIRVIPTADPIWSIVDERRGRLVPLNRQQISNGLRDHFERVGLAGVTAHRLRHWFATTMLQRGADLKTVSELLGHASPATTARYCLITDGQRRTAIQALPVLTSAPAPS